MECDRITQSEDRRYGRHDDGVVVLEKRLRRRQPHLLDVLVDRCVFLDVRIRRWDVCLGLVVIVVGDEVLDVIFREKLAHLTVELSGEGFVWREHNRRPLQALDHVRNRECLARASYAEQRLMR